jgi:hypothetical protein
MKYNIIHLFVKLTNLLQSKIVTTKVNKKIIFLFFIIAVIAMQLRTFTRFHWIIQNHVIHELYCHVYFCFISNNIDEVQSFAEFCTYINICTGTICMCKAANNESKNISFYFCQVIVPCASISLSSVLDLIRSFVVSAVK